MKASSMKALILASVLGVASLSVSADPVMSCDEVNEMGEALSGLAIALEDENAEIGIDSPEDGALRDVVEGLATIAGAEGDEDLANASLAMAEAWDNADQSAYSDALAEAIAKLAIIATTECED